MSRTRIDETGNRYGRLTVIEHAPKKGKQFAWLCRCDCGNTVIVRGAELRRGHTKSCGCLRKEIMTQRAYLHGMVDTPEYSSWMSMRQRCNNPNCRVYPLYGGRGITIDPRWDNFAVFYTDMGPKPGTGRQYSIDRIDNDGPYSPENCRWATQKEQCNNTSRNHPLTFNGRTMNTKQWAEKIGMRLDTLLYRVGKAGWSTEKALTTPVR